MKLWTDSLGAHSLHRAQFAARTARQVTRPRTNVATAKLPVASATVSLAVHCTGVSLAPLQQPASDAVRDEPTCSVSPMLRLRDDEEGPRDATTLIVHGGMGNIDYVSSAAIEHYEDYRVLRDDGLGYFTMSVFATIHEFSAEEIVGCLPHGSYGVAEAAEVEHAFRLLPTSDDDPALSPEMKALQAVHFDVCLPDAPEELLRTTDPLDDLVLLTACQSHLKPHLESLLALFTRRRKA